MHKHHTSKKKKPIENSCGKMKQNFLLKWIQMFSTWAQQFKAIQFKWDKRGFSSFFIHWIINGTLQDVNDCLVVSSGSALSKFPLSTRSNASKGKRQEILTLIACKFAIFLFPGRIFNKALWNLTGY